MNCKQLSRVSMKSLVHIGTNMFNGCDQLNEIILDSCTSMNNGCLNYCNSIKKVTLGYESVSFGVIPNPTVITHACFPKALSVPENSFLNYIELISIQLPCVSTIAGSAFEGCTRLTNLEIPKVIKLEGDKNFYNCESLESISLRSLVEVNPESQYIFSGCRQLQSIHLPDLPPKVFHPDTFKSLTSCSIYIQPDSISIYDNDVSIAGDEAGDGKWCSIELIAHQYIKVICDGEEGMGTTLFDACISTGLLVSEIEKLNIKIGMITQNELNLVNENFANLKELIIDSTVSIENEIIPQNFLKNHGKIESIHISSSLKTIEESSFEGCSKLASFICKNARELKSRCFYGPTLLESLSLELVESLSGSNFFSNNPILHTIELPKLKTASVDGYISENSPSLRSISLPENPPEFTEGTFLLDVNPLLIGLSNEAAINYDASDNVNNDMKYYSLKLSYILITCNIDGETKSGISLKSLVSEDSKVVEVIEGTIGANDFPLQSSIVSFTVHENVIVKTIPKNAFSSNTNLKTITIIPNQNAFKIEEEAFNGCTSLESVQINGATSIAGLAFNGCTHLKTVVLNDVVTITGNSNFNGCSELNSLSLKSLTTVNPDSSMIFLGCTQFKTLTLPSQPPTTFNKNAFAGLRDILNLVLPEEKDYITYDNDNNVEGSISNDGLWCGLILPTSIINIKVNKRNSLITGLKLSDCISVSGLSESSIKSLEITRGIIDITTLIETINKLPFLENLEVSKSIIFRGEWTEGIFSGINLVSINLPSMSNIPCRCFENCVSLKEVILDDAISVSTSAFKGCIKLETITLNVESFTGDSIFEGCTSLTSICVINLKSVDSAASNIFKDCPLTSINLPVNPPKTFHKDTFSGMNILIHGLSDDQLRVYDNNVEVDGDAAGDSKWCGIDLIQLFITIRINEKEPENSATLVNSVGTDPIESVTKIEISKGMVKKSHLNELKTFTQLQTFTITENAVLESSILDVEQFKDITTLITVKIMQDVSIMKNCFMGCTSLTSIEFRNADILNEGCFKDCSSLNEIFIPNCIELRGDSIFSSCIKLRDINLSSLLRVDNTATKIFEGCTQLGQISLPSIEPLTFNKATFTDCPEIILKLPNDDDYLAYDDLSHVADDQREDFKWCGITINSTSLPPLLKFVINDKTYDTRNLNNAKNDDYTTLKMLDDSENGENNNKIRSLKLVGGGVFDSTDLKKFLEGCDTITTFEASEGTLDEIKTGTFKGCTSLTEIIIHSEVKIENGAIANIPSLSKLVIDLQRTIVGGSFNGDDALQEISLPLLDTIPSSLFANLKNLNKVELNYTTLILNECFKGCTSLESLVLPKMKTLKGNSHFEGCTALKTIELPFLETVDVESANIFKDCSALSTVKLGSKPPSTFNNDVFKNTGGASIPNIELPDENDWKNYVYQCTVNPDTKHYMWKGFETPLTEDDNVVTCPEQSECSCPDISCPEQSEISCPEQSEISCPEQSECSCPEQSECSCPEINCPEQSECSCPEINCPEQSEYSCPELPVVSCPEQKNETNCKEEVIVKKDNKAALIALGVLCGIFAVAIIVLIVLYVLRLKGTKESFIENSDDLNNI